MCQIGQVWSISRWHSIITNYWQIVATWFVTWSSFEYFEPSVWRKDIWYGDFAVISLLLNHFEMPRISSKPFSNSNLNFFPRSSQNSHIFHNENSNKFTINQKWFISDKKRNFPNQISKRKLFQKLHENRDLWLC